MGKDFSELSDAARRAIVDAVLDIDVPNLSESVMDEIRDWATSPSPVWEVLKLDSWGGERLISKHATEEDALMAKEDLTGCIVIRRERVSA